MAANEDSLTAVEGGCREAQQSTKQGIATAINCGKCMLCDSARSNYKGIAKANRGGC